MGNYTALHLGREGVGETPTVGLRSCSLIKHISLGNTFITLSEVFAHASAHSNSPCQSQTAAKAQSGHQPGVLKPDPEPGLAGSRGNWRRHQRSQFWASCLLCFQPAHPVWLRGALWPSPHLPTLSRVCRGTCWCAVANESAGGVGSGRLWGPEGRPWLGRELCSRTRRMGSNGLGSKQSRQNLRHP
uniref:Uncharacterized protein n=1 Tax=Pipistrellus kuhlii TaxID=59472 RepID=A0A7J7YWJ4_PIPKU|nr:hypothetical protein mPipKuh1_009816 [Pipistrellus kuhlii]